MLGLTSHQLCNMICGMRCDSALSGVLHVLLHMAEFGGAVTSERLSAVICTNPVVVRRLMGGLRDLGLVASKRSHGGGWALASDFDRVSLGYVYVALGSPRILAMRYRNEEPTCLVEQAVNAALGTAFEDAERLLLERLGTVTLGRLSADFHARMAKRGLCSQETQPRCRVAPNRRPWISSLPSTIRRPLPSMLRDRAASCRATRRCIG
ncbi:hypothetical protein B2G69_25320 [Methylorubrum zatmanii]|nr:hypothetical protein B2G69_25320 [Methylorubrum zatmanii]